MGHRKVLLDIWWSTDSARWASLWVHKQNQSLVLGCCFGWVPVSTEAVCLFLHWVWTPALPGLLVGALTHPPRHQLHSLLTDYIVFHNASALVHSNVRSISLAPLSTPYFSDDLRSSRDPLLLATREQTITQAVQSCASQRLTTTVALRPSQERQASERVPPSWAHCDQGLGFDMFLDTSYLLDFPWGLENGFILLTAQRPFQTRAQFIHF